MFKYNVLQQQKQTECPFFRCAALLRALCVKIELDRKRLTDSAGDDHGRDAAGLGATPGERKQRRVLVHDELQLVRRALGADAGRGAALQRVKRAARQVDHRLVTLSNQYTVEFLRAQGSQSSISV